MPRDNQGVYTLPQGAGNPVQQGTTITSAWANTTFNDVATALTNSLDRDGLGGMRAPFRNVDGTEAAPGVTWSGDQASGLYLDGLGDMRVSIIGQDNFRWTSAGADIWAGGIWNPVLYGSGGGGGGLVPDGVAAQQTLSWDNNTGVWINNSALLVDFSLGNITVDNDIIMADGGTGPGEVDGRDVSQDGSTLDIHVQQVGSGSIHFPDAPNDSNQYARQTGAWAVVEPSGAVMPGGGTDGQTLKWDQPSQLWLNTSDVLVTDDGWMGVGVDPTNQGKITTDGDVVAGIGALGWLGNGSVGIRGVGNTLQGMFANGLGTDIRGTNLLFNDNSGSDTYLQNGTMGIGYVANPASRLDVNGAIYVENGPLIGGAKRISVSTVLPQPADPDTLYFLTGP